MVARAEERLEDVVVLPVVVHDVGELGIPLLQDLALVAADEDDVLFREAAGGERFEDPFEHRSTHDRDERLRDFFGPVLEPAAAAGADEDGTHACTLP
jgi:hypothetical protein